MLLTELSDEHRESSPYLQGGEEWTQFLSCFSREVAYSQRILRLSLMENSIKRHFKVSPATRQRI